VSQKEETAQLSTTVVSEGTSYSLVQTHLL